MRAELIIEFLLRSVKKSHELIHRFVAGIVIMCLCRVAALLRKVASLRLRHVDAERKRNLHLCSFFFERGKPLNPTDKSLIKTWDQG